MAVLKPSSASMQQRNNPNNLQIDKIIFSSTLSLTHRIKKLMHLEDLKKHRMCEYMCALSNSTANAVYRSFFNMPLRPECCNRSTSANTKTTPIVHIRHT